MEVAGITAIITGAYFLYSAKQKREFIENMMKKTSINCDSSGELSIKEVYAEPKGKENKFFEKDAFVLYEYIITKSEVEIDSPTYISAGGKNSAVSIPIGGGGRTVYKDDVLFFGTNFRSNIGFDNYELTGFLDSPTQNKQFINNHSDLDLFMQDASLTPRAHQYIIPAKVQYTTILDKTSLSSRVPDAKCFALLYNQDKHYKLATDKLSILKKYINNSFPLQKTSAVVCVISLVTLSVYAIDKYY